MAEHNMVPVTFRLDPKEYEKLKKEATKINISLSAYIRKSIFRRKLPAPPPPQINRDAWLELSKTTSNLNQLQKKINQGVASIASESLLESVKTQVSGLRKELIGIQSDSKH